MMEVIGIIQARTGSSRLPGKVMYPLDGEPAIAHEIRRMAAVDSIALDNVVVATSTHPRDDVLETTAKQMGASVYRGSEKDVLSRIAGAVAAFDADVAVRVGGDNPLFEPGLAEALVERLREPGTEYATSRFEYTFPVGQNADGFTSELITSAADDAISSTHKEHLGQYFADNRNAFSWQNVTATEVFDESFLDSVADFRKLRLTLDEPADYELFARLYESVPYEDILDVQSAVWHLVENNLRSINQTVDQNTWSIVDEE